MIQVVLNTDSNEYQVYMHLSDTFVTYLATFATLQAATAFAQGLKD